MEILSARMQGSRYIPSAMARDSDWSSLDCEKTTQLQTWLRLQLRTTDTGQICWLFTRGLRLDVTSMGWSPIRQTFYVIPTNIPTHVITWRLGLCCLGLVCLVTLRRDSRHWLQTLTDPANQRQDVRVTDQWETWDGMTTRTHMTLGPISRSS